MTSTEEALMNKRMRIGALTEIRFALDAVGAAVNGVEMNDTSQQRGISYWIGELYCKLGEVIEEMEGEKVENGQ